MPSSPLVTFLQGLFADGKTLVDPGPGPVSACAGSAALLSQGWRDDAWHFPGEAPDFDAAVASQSAVWLYHAAMCYADRSMREDLCARLLTPPPVTRQDAVAHYSADLTLRHLPALLELTSGLADADPVLVSLRRMAWTWPLSGVGVPWPEEWGFPDLRAIQGHPGLWRLYLDRVIRSGAKSNLREEGTQIAIRERLGNHPELAIRLRARWETANPSALPIPSQPSS